MKSEKDVSEWWSAKPMTYGGTHGATDFHGRSVELGSPEFFEQADQRLYAWNKPLHDDRPFGRLFPYDAYRGKKVLEIGCGMGAMTMNWARQGARMTAVDLTPTAVAQTSRRLALFGLSAEVLQADARSLPFEDAQFDYVYSWGVLHHSPDLRRSIEELMRVLKPGGGFGLMLYNRRSFLYAYTVRFVEGFLHYENRFLDPLSLASRYGDGAREEGNPHTWPITEAEGRDVLGRFSSDLTIDILGTDLDSVFPYLIPGLGEFLPDWFKRPWARRFGWSLWLHGHQR
jgi:SAM-dependent methyltransferase